MCAVDEHREPSNSAWHNLATLRLVKAASASADNEGRPERLDEQL